MNKNNLHHIKSTGFKTPQNYFESFDDQIFNVLKKENQLEAIKTSGFKVPTDYFETFDDELISHITNDTKIVPLFSWKKVAYLSGIAAALVVMFSLLFNNTNDWNKIETASIENYLTEEDFSNYEIASLLTDEELTADNFTDSGFSETSLENYLLENTTIEDLLID
jgi:hypothetical protein